MLISHIVVKTKAQIQAENDARVAEARARLGVQKVDDPSFIQYPKAQDPSKVKEVAVKPTKPEKCPEVFFMKAVDIQGQGSRMSFEKLSSVVSALKEKSEIRTMKLEVGVILTVYGKDRLSSRVLSRRIYKSVESAIDAGERIVGDGKGDSYTVSDTITREVLSGMVPISLETRRVVGPVCKVKDYDRDTVWRKSSFGDRNVRSNMNPTQFSYGWNV
jgi:hypothetical protein